MTSAGSLVSLDAFSGKDAILSGPAGRCGGVWRASPTAPAGSGVRLRHGRHEHGCQPLGRRGVCPPVRDRSGRRERQRAPDASAIEHAGNRDRRRRRRVRSAGSTARNRWSGHAPPEPTPVRPATGAAGRSRSRTSIMFLGRLPRFPFPARRARRHAEPGWTNSSPKLPPPPASAYARDELGRRLSPHRQRRDGRAHQETCRRPEAMTCAATRWLPSAARAASTPAPSPANSA